MKRTGAVVAAAAMLAAAAAVPVQGADREPRRFLTGWIPYWSTETGTSSFITNSDIFRDVSPFWFDARWDATKKMPYVQSHLDDAVRAEQYDNIRGHGALVLPSITDGTGRGNMAATLKSPAKRKAHIEDIVDLVVANGYDGIDLDYETFAFTDGSSTWAQTRPAWVGFVKDLADALHKQGKKLAVTVPPMYDTDNDASSGYWVYDYAAVGESADLVRIMAYDYSVGRAGPIAPLPWVQKVATFAGSQIPKRKVQLGVPVYGRNWYVGRTGKCPVGMAIDKSNYSMTSGRALASLAEDGVAPSQITRDAASGEATVSYKLTYRGLNARGEKTSCDIARTAFFVDDRAVADRVALARRAGLAGAALWTIGGEEASQWPMVRKAVGTQKSTAGQLPAASVTLGAPRYVTKGESATVTGEVTVSGEPTGGSMARLGFNPYGSAKWRKVGTAKVDRDGQVRFSYAPRISGKFRIAVSRSGEHKATRSRAVLTRVRPAVTVKGSVVAFAGQKVRMSGSIRPRVAGVTMTRQRLVGRSWQNVGSTRTSTDGSYAFGVVPTVKSTSYTYRVVSQPFDGYASGQSPTVIFRAR